MWSNVPSMYKLVGCTNRFECVCVCFRLGCFVYVLVVPIAEVALKPVTDTTDTMEQRTHIQSHDEGRRVSGELH